MRSRAFFWAPLLLFCLLSAETVAAATTTAPAANADDGTATGKRIGNTIAAIASAVFPPAQKIIDAIWPPKTANPAKAPSDAKTPDQAAAAAKQAKDAADKTLKASLDKLTALAANLSVARTFATACADADVRISVIRSKVLTKTNLTNTEIADLQDLWRPAYKRLNALQLPDFVNQVNALDDTFLQFTFHSVQTAIGDSADNINAQIAGGRVASLLASLNDLEPKIAAVAPLNAILIGDMASSLQAAAKTIASGGGGESGHPAGPPQEDRDANVRAIALIGVLNKAARK